MADGTVDPYGRLRASDGTVDEFAARMAHYAALETAGLCPICETASLPDDDMLCAPCRREADDRSSEVVDPVELALNEHWAFTPLCTEDRQVCRCRWSIDGGPGYHRRHLAEMIYEALGLDGPAPWIDGPKVEHPTPQSGRQP